MFFYLALSRMETLIISAVRVWIGFGDELDETLAAGTPNKDPRSYDSCPAITHGRVFQPMAHYENRNREMRGFGRIEEMGKT